MANNTVKIVVDLGAFTYTREGRPMTAWEAERELKACINKALGKLPSNSFTSPNALSRRVKLIAPNGTQCGRLLFAAASSKSARYLNK